MRRKKRNFPYLTFTFLLIIGLLAFGFFTYQNLIFKAVDSSNSNDLVFEIEEGSSAKTIASSLQEQGLIKNEKAFYYYARFQNQIPKIASGKFPLNPAMNVPEILEVITNPPKAESISFTIQEGLTIKQIDEKLASSGLIENGEFINSVNNFDRWSDYSFLDQAAQTNIPYKLEGFIYPDTYFLDSQNFTPESLISKALENFQNKTNQISLNYKDYSIHEIITMASIVENEVFGKEDRKKVAGLLWKRLENNWQIGADITVIYVTENRDITYQDLQVDSPYNTRKITGLPPGPISNPSLESIEATVNPIDTDFWFYLTTLDTGEVIYSRDNSEHEMNKNKYLR